MKSACAQGISAKSCRSPSRLATLGAVLLLGSALLTVGGGHADAHPDRPGCHAPHWVGAWTASPSDMLSITDPASTPQLSSGNQSYRVVVTPHWGGSQMRLHLTNRFRPVPITFGKVTVGTQAAAGAIQRATLHSVTFQGRSAVTVAPGGDMLSDPVDFPVTAWRPISVSMFVPGPALLPTEHFNGNVTSYYTLPGAGDHTSDSDATAFGLRTTSVPLASGIDVLAQPQVSSVVTLGDSITDGYIAANYLGVPQATAAVDADARYPDFLQHRLDTARRPLSVLDAGITGNRVIADGTVPQFGSSAVARLQHDVLDQPGVSDVIVLEGINDLGVPIGVNYEQLVEGYTNLITRLRGADLHVQLGTLLPASNAVLDGLSAPLANSVRLRLNDWIRSQTLADGVIDFAAALQDPANPNVLDPRVAGPDNLHPSVAGYRRMADVINLAALHGNGCG